mmetsp:Transcript_35405/g.52000  ORF Transcript_35405/g.52000 Transcript_35405/m.52000 type:complete len:289 (-) Transcript_35405:425-1291(-)|eukprot:CAMPEP_0195523540 /NCGR_PEP_ID=MMETSP0794_2-20130614/22805_1 /TAXON_ID=515487 /ORGANISM="Stephanopyxis turris, Strain CCMP 815" /LENGTH=288 /DNA_ID=CAMNT_0040653561 /DNA_START=213 /DNA_END=1079 /DNA_ORIENTATION=-
MSVDIEYVRSSHNQGHAYSKRCGVEIDNALKSDIRCSSKEADPSQSQCDILLFDLDGTLYTGETVSRLNAYTQERILDFLVNTKGCPKFDAITTRDQAYVIWRPLIERYNQTVRGLLMDGFEFDVDYCNRAIRDGSEQFLKPDVKLKEALMSLPQRKMIFSNAPEATARTYLKKLGIADCFEEIFGMDFMGTGCCKPDIEAYHKVLNYIGINPKDPVDVGRICFFEDNARNLLQGQALGMQTVFIRRRSPTKPRSGKENKNDEYHDDFDAVVDNLGTDLRNAMPSLWL